MRVRLGSSRAGSHALSPRAAPLPSSCARGRLRLGGAAPLPAAFGGAAFGGVPFGGEPFGGAPLGGAPFGDAPFGDAPFDDAPFRAAALLPAA